MKNKETKVRIAHIIEAGWPRGGKNGGRVLEVSLCHCTACHPLPGPHPFSVIYNDQIVPLEECCEWVWKRGAARRTNSPEVIDNQTDVSSLEWTSDAKSELTVFVVREILYIGSRALNGATRTLWAILFLFNVNKVCFLARWFPRSTFSPSQCEPNKEERKESQTKQRQSTCKYGRSSKVGGWRGLNSCIHTETADRMRRRT